MASLTAVDLELAYRLVRVSTRSFHVSSCVTSLPEVLGEDALLVEPTDCDAIFEAAREVLTDPELARDLSHRGRLRARRYPWRRTAQATLEAYRLATSPPEEGAGFLRAL